MTNKRKHLFWFKIIAISLPLLILLLFELLLRGFDVGLDLRLFVEHPQDQDYLIFNSKVSRRYFVNDQFSTIGYVEPFKKEKDPNTLRIFVQGGSTALGFPYENNASFHRMLQYQFNLNFPELPVEIINLSLTAVNSYTLLDFADEIIEREPDAVLIYAGHNEFYGALGVGSSNKLGQNPILVRLGIELRRLRLGRILSSLLSRPSQGESPELNAGMMQRLAAEQSIKKNSKLFDKGINQFNQNMSLLLSKYQEHQIPVFIGTLVSNLKDQPPFVSDPSTHQNADYYYKEGKQFEELGNYDRSLQFFTLAKEEDLLRFRAPEAMNQNIKSLASQYEAVVVPVVQEFRANSPNGIIGKELILEHLHPNLDGYYLLSTSFYRSMVKTLNFDERPGQKSVLPFAELPLTQMDSFFGNYQNVILRSQWPFSEPLPTFSLAGKEAPEVMAGGLIDKKVSWEEAMQNLYRYYQANADQRNVLKVVESMALAYPLDHLAHLRAGELALELEDFSKAFIYFRRTFMLTSRIELLNKAVTAGLHSEDFDGVLRLLHEPAVKRLNNPLTSRVTKDVTRIKQLEHDLKSNANNVDLIEQLKILYQNYGITENSISN